mmetsp:Transcript_1428/g.1391  ORF Transcript_1428/g.1391 Transcript_1428/m.1391 type:complete len:133 (+) Transcript_1428:3-401(+)
MRLLIPSLYVLMAHFMGTLCVGDIMLNYNPTPPRFPPSFAASFVMKLPYIDLHIQMTVRQVMESGLQHVSFYDGLEQHFVNMASDEIYHVVYNGTRRICLDATERGSSASMINIFPNMEGCPILEQRRPSCD